MGWQRLGLGRGPRRGEQVQLQEARGVRTGWGCAEGLAVRARLCVSALSRRRLCSRAPGARRGRRGRRPCVCYV